MSIRTINFNSHLTGTDIYLSINYKSILLVMWRYLLIHSVHFSLSFNHHWGYLQVCIQKCWVHMYVSLTTCSCISKQALLHIKKCVLMVYIWILGARGGAVGWCTSRGVTGSIPDGVPGIFHWHDPSGRTMALELTRPLTEMSTVFMADNLTTFMCRLSWDLGAWTSWNPQGLSRPVMEFLYLYLYL